MMNLVNAVAQIQSQIHLVPNILHKVSREDGTVTVSVYSPGSQREADTFTFSVLFVVPEEYPESPTWLMSDNEAINDMLSAVTEEFIGGATLETLLSRVLALFGHETEQLSNLFTSSEKAFESGAEGGEEYYTDDFEDDYSGLDDELEDDKELMVELGRRQGRWEKFEAEYQEKILFSDKPKPQHSSKEKLAEDRQIFDASSAFKMLSNELLGIMKEQAFDMIVDTVDDDVYHWSVEFAGFEDDSLLANDLAKLGRTFGYCTIQLRLMFKRELHPFYPPKVELRRPRFKGPIALAISSHPMFTLRYWDPWRSQKKLLSEIKSFLQRHARVDYQSMCNSIAHYPISAYSDAERQLAMLEALSEVPPRWASIDEYKVLRDWSDVHVDLERIAALTGETEESNPPPPPEKSNQGKKKSYWAAGTGYGHGSSHGQSREIWDVKKATTAQNAHDIEMQTVLEDLAKSLFSEIETMSIESANEERSSDSNFASGLIPTLNASCLVPFITRELDNVSFTNMCERASYYLSIVKLVDQLCLPISVKVFYSATTKEKSIYQCVSQIEDQAKCYTKVINSKDGSKSYSGPSGPPLPPSLMALRGDAEKEENLGMVLANAVTDCMDSLRHYRYLATTEELELNEGTSSEEAETYESTMKSFQIDFSEDLADDHMFENDSKREQASPKDRLVRLGREIAGLKSLLPLNPMSSVFVRIDEQKQTLWKALIVGPEDTPYSGGCFIFDIYFPSAYPHSSPKVLLKTTGGGTVRFNPNLYDNGTVCLSLLGTWSGAAGETWDPNASSICQVLISIQSLIFVNEPYFNEPGYEKSMHSETGRKASKDYNQNIREHTIHRAMIDHLKSPTGPFAETLLSHFKLRKEYILNTCNKWVQEAEGDEANAHADRLKALVSELEQLLNGISR